MSNFLSRLLGLPRKPIKKRTRSLRFDILEDRTVPSTVHFAAIGDSGSATGDDGHSRVNELNVANWIHNQINPHFIIMLGDNSYHNGAVDQLDKNIGQFYSDYMYPYINPHFLDKYP